MEPLRVVVIQSSEDPIASELIRRLRASDQFKVISDTSWSDRDIGRPFSPAFDECSLVVLVCPFARNEELSRALLRQHPELVVVRIDTDSQEKTPGAAITVDLVRHVALDQRRFGFERLLTSMRFLVERRGIGPEDRLLRFLVLGDTGSIGTEGVRFLEVGSTVRASDPVRRLPGAATVWLNAAIQLYFNRCSAMDGEGASFFVSRQRAHALLAARQSAGAQTFSPSSYQPLEAAAQALADFCKNPAHADEPLVQLWRRLGLALDDLKVFIVCLAPEIDLDYQLIFGHIHDDMNRRFATTGLIDALLEDQVARTTGAVCTLLDWKLIAAGAGGYPSADGELRPDPSLLQWLTVGGDALLMDPLVDAVTRAEAWPGRELVTMRADEAEEAALTQRLLDAEPVNQWTVLTGPDAEGWRALIERAFESANAVPMRVIAERFAKLELRLHAEAAIRIGRAARLMDRHIVIECATPDIELTVLSSIIDAQTEIGKASFLLIEDSRLAARALPVGRWSVRSRRPPSLEARQHLFSETLARLNLFSRDADERSRLAEHYATAYPLGIEGLATAAAIATANTSRDSTRDERIAAFITACRRVATPDLLQLAHRIEPVFDLNDVILPEDRKVLLREIVGNVQNSRKVLEQWGFGAQLPYGRGVAALFAGSSGTGKTMAAQAIARRLGVDVFAVDLSRLVSKYIGETEKHLDSVFNDAERSGSVLLFDEADALFGKRSEVKDSHDRYANLEVAYLLQRMESFGGLAILTTNHRHRLDKAFARRLRFIVDFPKPDAAARQSIWRQCIPDSAPLANNIDWRMLARFDLTGGAIRQITLRAAFLAACDEPAIIQMKHLIGALRAELNKLGSQTAERELTERELVRAASSSEAA